jgi:hypothetical protein
MRIKKISLSPSLEKKFFDERLSKREIVELKNLSEAYQRYESLSWSELRYRPYSQYFGFINALKTKKVLEELWNYSYLSDLTQPIEFLDFGAGSLGASLGATDFFREKNLEVEKIYAIDQDSRVTNWAAQFFQDFLPRSIEHRSRFPNEESKINIMANVWNEILFRTDHDSFQAHPAWKDLETRMMGSAQDSLWIFIEPSAREINQKFLKLRDALRLKFNVLLPCTHRDACPALAENEWCHEERAFRAPNPFWELVRSLGYRQKNLVYSFMVIGKKKSVFGPSHARVLSRDLGGKGRCEKWLCSDGKRWKESHLLREKNEDNLEFFESLRGDIIERPSTFLDKKS